MVQPDLSLVLLSSSVCTFKFMSSLIGNDCVQMLKWVDCEASGTECCLYSTDDKFLVVIRSDWGSADQQTLVICRIRTVLGTRDFKVSCAVIRISQLIVNFSDICQIFKELSFYPLD